MRASRLYPLLLTALFVWAAATQSRVAWLDDQLLALHPTLGRLAERCTEASTSLGREIAAANERVEACREEMRASQMRAGERATAAGAEIASLRRRVAPDAEALHERMLAPTVRLEGDTTYGSGTLIWSGQNAQTGRVETYVLTAYHVVRDILGTSLESRKAGILHTIYTRAGKVEARGDLVAFSTRIDAALVLLREAPPGAEIARVLPRSMDTLVRVTDPVCAVGCPLGKDPILTRGEISSLTNEIAGGNYWMLTAPTYFGNSGGGIFLAESMQLIGVFSKIHTSQQGESVVTHMGLCMPIAAVREWLEGEGHAFVLEQQARGLTEDRAGACVTKR